MKIPLDNTAFVKHGPSLKPLREPVTECLFNVLNKDMFNIVVSNILEAHSIFIENCYLNLSLIKWFAFLRNGHTICFDKKQRVPNFRFELPYL